MLSKKSIKTRVHKILRDEFVNIMRTCPRENVLKTGEVMEDTEKEIDKTIDFFVEELQILRRNSE